jgi:hypothetical protein
MAVDYRIPVFPKDHRDFAWKWVIMEKPLEFLLFLLPYLVTMKDPSRDIKADAQVIVPLVGAQTDKYSRFADVVFEIPVENEDFNIIFEANLNNNNSRILPFRYINAVNYASKYLHQLDKAIQKSLEKLDRLDGKTVILVDVSGSMS